jgi:hypothetical protein
MGSRSPQLIPFKFDDWVFYLIYFNPSLLSSLLAGYFRCAGHLSSETHYYIHIGTFSGS